MVTMCSIGDKLSQVHVKAEYGGVVRKKSKVNSAGSSSSAPQEPAAPAECSKGAIKPKNVVSPVPRSLEHKNDAEESETPSLAADRRKKERIAGKFGRVVKQKSASTQSSNALIVESSKRWTAEDDVGLISAVTHVTNSIVFLSSIY